MLAPLRANPHTQARQEYHRGDFGKLSRVTPRTLQFISRHPEELEPVARDAGIRVGEGVCVPRKTLLLDTRRSLDCYENRVILGFLRRMAADIRKLRDFDRDDQSVGALTAMIGAHAFGQVRQSHERALAPLEDQLNRLTWSYGVVLPVAAEPMSAAPRPTAVFRNPGPHRQLYQVMAAWFGMGDAAFLDTDVLLPLVNHQLYEYYALYRMAALLEDFGFAHQPGESRCHVYPSPGVPRPDKVCYMCGRRVYLEGTAEARGEFKWHDCAWDKNPLNRFAALRYPGATFYIELDPAEALSPEARGRWDARLRDRFHLGQLDASGGAALERLEEQNQKLHNNLFVFRRGGERIDLYYQPVVYGRAYPWLTPRERAEIPLRRTTPAALGEHYRSYWLPDYLMRYRARGDVERWLVVDAKYRPWDAVTDAVAGDVANLYKKYIRELEVDPGAGGDIPKPRVAILCGRPGNHSADEINAIRVLPFAAPAEAQFEEMDMARQRQAVAALLELLTDGEG